MKTLFLTAASALVLTLAASAAHAEVYTAGSVGGFSDYRLRGVSLSEKNPVIQGSLEIGTSVTENISVFAGVWASSLDVDAAGGFGSLETDFYVGAKGTAGDFGWSAKYLRLVYTDGVGDFDQYAVEGTYPIGPLAGALGVVYDDYGTAGDSTYVYSSLGYTIPDTPFAVKAGVGWEDGAFYDGKTNWSLGATYTYKKLVFGAEYIDSDVDIDGPSEDDIGGSTVVFSVSSSF